VRSLRLRSQASAILGVRATCSTTSAYTPQGINVSYTRRPPVPGLLQCADYRSEWSRSRSTCADYPGRCAGYPQGTFAIERFSISRPTA